MLKKWSKTTGKFWQMREVRVSLCATDLERRAVYRLRHRVFNEELGANYPHRNGCIEKPWDAQSYHLQAVFDGRLAGGLSFYRLSDGPEDESIEEFWGTGGLRPDERARTVIAEQAVVLPAHRGRGVAVALFWQLYASALEMGAEVGLMSCLPELARYYTPFGWQWVGNGRHPWLGPELRHVLRHHLHHLGPMLRRGSPLALQLVRWRLRGSRVTRPLPCVLRTAERRTTSGRETPLSRLG